jgi:hypothetical protein
MCVYCHMSKKYRVSRSGLIFFFYFIIGKTGNSRSGIRFRYFIFEIFGKPSFVEAVFINYDELCSFSTFIALNFDKKLAVE